MAQLRQNKSRGFFRRFKFHYRYRATYLLILGLFVISGCVFLYTFALFILDSEPSNVGMLPFLILYGITLVRGVVDLLRSFSEYNPLWKEEGFLVRKPKRLLVLIPLILLVALAIVISWLMLSGAEHGWLEIPFDVWLWMTLFITAAAIISLFDKDIAKKQDSTGTDTCLNVDWYW